MNYRRVPLQEQLAYDSSRLTRDRAVQFARAAVDQVNALRPAAGSGPPDDSSLAGALFDVQRQLGVDKRARPTSPKRSLLELYFRKAAIDGMTDPFFLEIIRQPRRVAVGAALRPRRTSGRIWRATPTNPRRTSWHG